MIQKLHAGFFVGLLYLISPIGYAHVDGVHAMSLLDGLVHFITQPSHIVWIVLAAAFVLLYRFGDSLSRLYKRLQIRITRRD